MTFKLSAAWPITAGMRYGRCYVILSALAFAECLACVIAGLAS